MFRVPQMGLTCGVDNLDKLPKTAWKSQNQYFWGKTVSGDMGGQANFSGRGRGDAPSPPYPTRRNSDVYTLLALLLLINILAFFLIPL